jgi:hypothetical protein
MLVICFYVCTCTNISLNIHSTHCTYTPRIPLGCTCVCMHMCVFSFGHAGAFVFMRVCVCAFVFTLVCVSVPGSGRGISFTYSRNIWLPSHTQEIYGYYVSCVTPANVHIFTTYVRTYIHTYICICNFAEPVSHMRLCGEYSESEIFVPENTYLYTYTYTLTNTHTHTYSCLHSPYFASLVPVYKLPSVWLIITMRQR